ncbi:Zinc finger, PHD-finger [Dillenia turbinata]|uniref:Zinc finger, PHD-finger n=1 Tax=Dillenia turbinata TaxID=194707 RepID=A0AAN8Z5Q5_9MAGN
MSSFELISCKKRKRGERTFRFKTFGEHGHPALFNGVFRRNVESLIEFGDMESNFCRGMTSWSFQLEVYRHPPLHIFLFVIVEPIEAAVYRSCKHCQYVGWGHHMKCNKKYHFVVPSKGTAAMIGADLSCPGNCGRAHITKDRSELVEIQGHALHGVFHSNGFGHLLCINGMEMGSDLTGHQIMELWDRLCIGLRARKVSLCDYSMKRSMDLRLIYGVAYGEPWFGKWGYRFGRGSYGANQSMYQKAIEAVQNITLCSLVNHFDNHNYHDVSLIVSRYQLLSDHSLVTLGDLFHFMMELKSHLPKETCIDSYGQGILVETTCRWSQKRVELATRVIVEALRKSEFRWVSRQEVRDAARAYIGDTGLLDFVLKSLGNHVVGNYLVRRSLNPVTKVLEYCLEDMSKHEGLVMNDWKVRPRHKITSTQLMKDISYLYKYIHQKPMAKATRIILDTKFFVKKYFGEHVEEIPTPKLYCSVLLKQNEGQKAAMLPYECVILEENATMERLKLEVEKCFKEVYWGMKSLVVESVAHLNSKGSDLVFSTVEPGSKLVFEGRISEGGDIYECGLKSCIVDCPCGAKDDDGERMISCDICEIWQHTRCIRIPSNEEIPHIFLCKRCEQDIVLFPSPP